MSSKYIVYSLCIFLTTSLVVFLFNSETGDAKKKSSEFDTQLQWCSEQHAGIEKIFNNDQYTFGLPPRNKYYYSKGILSDAAGHTIRSWHLKSDIVNHAENRVVLTTESGIVTIYEDTEGIFIKEGYKISTIEKKRVSLPEFSTHQYPLVAKALYHIYMVDTANIALKKYHNLIFK